MEFKAEVKDGVVEVKPIIVRKGNDVTIHVPSFPLIQKLKQDYQDGKRDLQPIQSELNE